MDMIWPDHSGTEVPGHPEQHLPTDDSHATQPTETVVIQPPPHPESDVVNGADQAPHADAHDHAHDTEYLVIADNTWTDEV
jgi:hypothetical protein